MVGTNIANDGDTAQPAAHILKLWDSKTTADGLFGSTVVHVTVKFGERSHRCDLHGLPYWWHGWHIVFLEMLLDKLIFRTAQLFLEVPEISLKQIAVFSQGRIHKPECAMSFCKNAYYSGSDCYLYMLNGRKEENTQFFVETIKTQYLGESGTILEDVLLPICLHQSPIACQTEVADDVKGILGLCIIINLKPTLFKNVYLLLEREQLFRISHASINKKCPALVRCIPCGREAMAGSIECKGTAFIRDCQTFCRKSG